MGESAVPPASSKGLPARHDPAKRRDIMVGSRHPKSAPDKSAPGLTPEGVARRTALGLLLGAPLLSACSNVQQSFNQFSQPSGAPQQPAVVGNGHVKVGLILPLSAAGNAGLAAQSMKSAAEMALAEFQ